MTKDIKESIEEVIGHLNSGFLIDAENEHRDEVTRLMEKYGDKLLNPDSFHFSIDYPHEELTDVLLRTLLYTEQTAKGVPYEPKVVEELILLYQNYDLIDNNMDTFIEKMEGMSCSADKSHFIVREFRQYLISHELPVWKDRAHFWIPHFGEPQEWFTFMESIISLAYGEAQAFIDAHHQLTEQIIKEKEAFESERALFFTTHEHFTVLTEKEKADVYTFTDGFHCVAIYVTTNHRDGFRCEVVDTQEVLAYSDEKPEWVNDLLKHL